MPCKIQIKENIKTEVETRSNAGFNMSLKGAQSLAAKVNQDFQAEVVNFYIESDGIIRRMNIPDDLVDKYYQHELMIENKEAGNVQKQDAERAGQEYDDQYLFNQLEEALQKLEDFKLYEDTNKLCGEGVCNYTSFKSTQKLEEVGLNPYPNVNGSSLSVNVKTPIGDFLITHYVAAVAINDGIYVYDMPQHEFISDTFYGKGEVNVKTEFKPRLIPLTVEDVSANYLLSEKESIQFIKSIVELRGNNIAPSFKEYIKSNVKNADSYIQELEDIYKNLPDKYESYESKVEKLSDKFYNEPLTKEDRIRISKLLTNKFKIRTRQYVPRKAKEPFMLSDFLQKTIGVPGYKFQYNSSEGLDEVLKKLRSYLRSEDFISTMVSEYDYAKNRSLDKQIEKVFSMKRLMDSFIRQVQSVGWDQALKSFDKQQRYDIQILLSQRIENKSDDQKVAILRRSFSNIDKFINSFGLKVKPGESKLDALFRENFKVKAKALKIKNTLDLMKSSEDVDFLFSLIAPEIIRQYSYFQSQGQNFFQLEEASSTAASPEIIDRVKELLKKMGVDVESLTEYAKKSSIKISGVNAVADLVKGVIAVTEGKEDVALTEEMVHIATAIIEQKNPSLVTQMISKIDRFKIYKQTFETYKNSKFYQLPNGKPDIRKIKKEAVDKLITELIVNGNKGDANFPELAQEENVSLITRWWNAISDFFRGIYNSSNIDIFQQTAQQIMEGGVEGQVSDVVNKTIYAQGRTPYIKPGVEEIFNQNPNLASIGTPEQYSAYLDSIFPDSRVKDIVYHGGIKGIDKFNPSLNRRQAFGPGVYFSSNPLTSLFDYATISPEDAMGMSIEEREEFNTQNFEIYRVVIDIKNPQIVQEGQRLGQKDPNTDGVLVVRELNDEGDLAEAWYVVNDSSKTHILGNENDVQGFREFVESRAAGEGLFFQLAEPTKDQVRVRDAILETSSRLRKVESKELVDPILSDTEEASNFYELKNVDGTWTRIKKRVTDRVKSFYKDAFRNKEFTEAEKKFNEFKRVNGVKFHKFFENIHLRYFDPQTGVRRASVLDRNMIFEKRYDEEVYNSLESYFQDLIKFHSKNGNSPLFLSEVMIYDQVEKEAGTVDLLIIDNDGTAHIYDWKFMSIGEDAKDVAWYKKGAYQVQLGRYRDILAKNYDIKKFGRNRAIPIGFNLAKINPNDNKSDLYVKGIRIGSVTPNVEISLSLAPVLEERESTGVKELDNMLKLLNSLHEQIGKLVITSNEEKEYKSERLNILKRAARSAQVNLDIAPLIEVVTILGKEGKNIINNYIANFEGKLATDETLTDKDISEMSSKMNEFLEVSSAISSIAPELQKFIYNDGMQIDEKQKEMRIQLKEALIIEIASIAESRAEIVDLTKSFADKFIGQRRSITGLLDTEATVGWFQKTFRTIGQLPQKSLKLLYRIINNARDKAVRDALVDISKIEKLREKLESRGNLKDVVKKIYQKDKARTLTNKLIRKYNKDFYELIDENAKEGERDKNVIYDNVDLEGYNQEVKKIIESRTLYITQIYDDEKKQKELIEDEKKKWLVDRPDFNGWNNYVLKRHPQEKHLSDEYLELQKDEDLFELYNEIVKINEKAKEVGYLNNDASLNFLPFVRKSMIESLSSGINVSTVSNFLDNFNLRADDVGYGNINSLTGELEHSIPKYFTYDFTIKSDNTKDYSDVSRDIFKNMIMYIEQMHKYKYLSEVEDQIKNIRTVETFKNHYQQTATSTLVTKNNKPNEFKGNQKNIDLFDKFVTVLLYGQKYPDGGDVSFDITRVTNFLKEAVNKVANKEVYTIDDSPTPLSLVKTMDMANRAFQIKTLGFEFISGAVNIFGGNIQLATQAGNYFKAREVGKNQILLIGNKWKNDDERKMFEQLLELFMPLKETPIYKRMLAAGMSPLTKINMTDWLMIFMREPELHLERSIFKTLLDNMMVENGKIISITEYVKNKYPDRYKSASEYRKYKKVIDNEIQNLKNTRSISATKKLEDGKLVIPGLDLSNTSEIQRLTNLTKSIARDATGGLSETDINGMSMSVWSRSMMVFKNWIPKLVDTRFGEFRKVGDDFSTYINEDGLTMGEKYDIGRIRLWWSLMGFNIVKSAKTIRDIILMNDDGLLKLNEMYNEYAVKYESETGEPLRMSREEFYDLIRTNLRNQMKELSILVAVSASVFAVGLIPPDEDDNKADRNRFRFVQRVLDKFQSELMFFYNPGEIQGIISGSVFPAVGLLSDLTRFITHLTMELTGVDLSDPTKSFEEVREKAQPVKQLARMFPFTKSMITYGAIIDEEFAKEFDVTIQKESRR